MSSPVSFVTWFGLVLDDELAKVPPAKQAAWLQRQSAVWQTRHRRFIDTDGDSEMVSPHPEHGVPTLFDMLGFIAEIEKRLSRAQVPA